MQFDQYESLIKKITSKGLESRENLQDVHDLLVGMSDEGLLFDVEQRKFAMRYSKFAHEMCQYMAGQTGDVAYEEMYWQFLKVEAQNRNVDSYFLYLEKNRDPDKRFYEPRRDKFLQFGVTQGMQALVDDDVDLLTISMPPGSGKLLADDTKVLTRNGWKCHGDLVVGDEVISPDGRFVKVQRVFPKDYADILITFSNGEKIQCHRNHEWLVYDRKNSTEHIIETNRFLKYKIDCGTPNKRGHRYLYQIPKHEYVIGEEKDLAVPPYVMGAWLGDGTNRKPTLTICDTDTVIVDKVIESGYPQTTCFDQVGCKAYSFSGLRQDLHAYGLCNKNYSTPKRIPDVYLTASIEQRLELLAGLLDTDGTLDIQKGRYHFSTVDTELLSSFVTLVSTFGWRTCVTEQEPATSTGGITGHRLIYTVGFNPDIRIPCLVERKRLKECFSSKKISIVAVEYAEPKQGNCIQVEGGLYMVGETLITTHNSTAGIFFLSGCMGWEPEMPNLASAHSGILTRSFYDGVSQILTDPVEYTWHEIFPHVKFNSRGDMNSKEQTINVGKPNRFKSLTCRAINASLTGATRCENILYADDLTSGLEEALSKERMDKLWQTYNTDLKTRKKNFCKEIHIATRWSVGDIIGHIQREHENDPRARFISIPAYDENGESNFNYKYGVGFTTEYFKDMEKSMDDISFKCLYMNQPIEREGLLYHDDELKRYLTLPAQKPDAVLSIVDTKNKGTDFFAQPVLLKYGDMYYLDDCVFSDESDYEIQYASSKSIIMRNHVEACHFESNNGGDRVSFEVDKRLKEAGYYCNITQEFTTANKETKIIIYAPWVKEHIYFKDKSLYTSKSDYGKMMSQLLSHTIAGKVDHDDACDVLASFAKRVGTPPTPPSRVISSPF